MGEGLILRLFNYFLDIGNQQRIEFFFMSEHGYGLDSMHQPLNKENWLNKHFPQLNATANTIYRAMCIYHANDSWLAWRRLIKHQLKIRRPFPNPPFLTIAVTYECICRCVHCAVSDAHDDSRSEMTTDQIRCLIDQAKKMGVLQITFTGGEPLLREDLDGACQVLS